MSTGATRAIFLALGANAGITLAKGFAAVFTGSGAMLAESIHSLADCANQVLLLVGMRRARVPPDPEHPLGHGREVYFWSFLVALLLFSMGGLFSIREGIHKLAHPEPISRPWLAMAILLLASVLEGISFAGCLREMRAAAKGEPLRQYLTYSRDSELLVVLGEDSAALLGMLMALVAVGLSTLTGDPRFDAAGSVAIGALLVVVAILLSVRIHSLLVGQSASPRLRDGIRASLAGQPEVAQVINLITLELGSHIMVAAKVRMRETTDAPRLVDDINRCEQALRVAHPRIRWLFFEPDVMD